LSFQGELFIKKIERKEVRKMGTQSVRKLSKQIAKELGMDRKSFKMALRCNMSFVHNEQEVRSFMQYAFESMSHKPHFSEVASISN
jgi:hypothetical protein